MNKQELSARKKVAGINQEHLFSHWHSLNENERNFLLQQIEHLDLAAYRQQRDILTKWQEKPRELYSPFTGYHLAGNTQEIAHGHKLLREGKAGCILAAGGQGTRLRFDGPKGAFPVSVVKHKSLFQIFAEKTIAAGKQAGKRLKLAIMTSPQNYRETVDFFSQHQNFGLAASQLSFFTQPMLPLLNAAGNLFLEEKNSFSVGPDGNGSCLQAFVESGIWEVWKAASIDYVNFVVIDNPLADPFDPNLLGHHAETNQAVTIKSIVRENSEERVGIVVASDRGPKVVEYTEISKEDQSAINKDGSLTYACANISLFCFSMDFIQEAASKTDTMPLHLAFKAVKALDEEGNPRIPERPNAYKFERFIFDVLPLADRVSTLLYPRERCFAPLKNAEASDSPATVREALQRQDSAALEALTGHPAPEEPFELSQDFHYPTPAFQSKWHNKYCPLESYYNDSTLPKDRP